MDFISRISLIINLLQISKNINPQNINPGEIRICKTSNKLKLVTIAHIYME